MGSSVHSGYVRQYASPLVGLLVVRQLVPGQGGRQTGAASQPFEGQARSSMHGPRGMLTAMAGDCRNGWRCFARSSRAQLHTPYRQGSWQASS